MIDLPAKNINQNKNILFLGTQMARAGAQNVLLTQAGWFFENGYEVTAVFFYDKQDLNEEWGAEYDFPIVNLNAWHALGNNLSNAIRLSLGLIKLYRLMKKNKFDIVETFTPHSNVLGLSIAYLARIPLRVGSHHGKIENAPEWLSRWHGLFANSKIMSYLVAVSSQIKTLAVEEEGVKKEKVIVIHNGINIPSLTSDVGEIRDNIRTEFEVSMDVNIVITLGRIVIQKGHRYLVDAIPMVLEKHAKTIFAIAGEGDLMDEVRSRAEDLGIIEHLKFLGNRKDVKNLLIAADVFVLSSLWEGLPIAMLEAMAYEKPIVVTDVEGVLDIIENKKQGIIVESKDVIALANGISYMLANPREANLMGEQARKLVESHHSVEVMCGNYEKTFMDSIPE